MSLILVSAASAPPVSLTCIAQDSLAGPMSPDILLASPSSSHSVSSFQTHCQSQSRSLSKKVLDPIFIKVIRSGLIHFRGWPLASSGLCKNVRLCPSRCPTGQLPHYPPPPELFKSQSSSVLSPIETMPSGNAYIWCFNKVQVLVDVKRPCHVVQWKSGHRSRRGLARGGAASLGLSAPALETSSSPPWASSSTPSQCCGRQLWLGTIESLKSMVMAGSCQTRWQTRPCHVDIENHGP